VVAASVVVASVVVASAMEGEPMAAAVGEGSRVAADPAAAPLGSRVAGEAAMRAVVGLMAVVAAGRRST
jgi:hypothetical protein